MIRTMAMAAALLCAGTAQAQLSVVTGPVEGDVISVTDADTLKVAVYPWTDELRLVNVRIRGVDAPELRGACSYEKDLAQTAKRFTADLIAKSNNRVKLYVIGCNASEGAGFGRCLSYVHAGGVDISKALIDAGLARRNFGEKRQPWCPAP